jgi:sporulation protein YlmC with PRC-barrel domain
MHNRAVIRATELNGRAVVDLDGAEKVGKIDRVVLDPDAQRVAAFLVSRGASVGGETLHMTVPASSVHAIGPDALTIHRTTVPPGDASHRIDNLPKASDLIGCKVVSEDGRFLGRIEDVLISREDGRILGYTLSGHTVLDRVEGFFRREKKHHEPYLRGDAELRTGEEMIIAPEGAISEEWEVDDDGSGPEVVCAWSRPESERRGIEPGAPLAPGTTIRRSD